MLDSHSPDCDFDFVAVTFSARTSSGRSESSSHSLTRCKVDGQCLSSSAHAWRWLVSHLCACMVEHFQAMAGNAALSLKKKKLKELGEDKANVAKFSR